MNAQLQGLVDLQAMDDQISEIKKALAAIPGQVESGRSHLEQSKNELDRALKVIESLNEERKTLERDVQAENDHMIKAKGKLPLVKTNKEYSALLAEVDAIKENVSGKEDKELEIMESLEEKEKELGPLKSQCREEEETFNQYKAKKEAEAKRIKQELETLTAKRGPLVTNLDPEWCAQYEKVFKFLKGQAVVHIQGSICQGCFQQLLPQMVIDVKTGEEIQQCNNCGRILYWVEEPSTESAVPK